MNGTRITRGITELYHTPQSQRYQVIQQNKKKEALEECSEYFGNSLANLHKKWNEDWKEMKIWKCYTFLDHANKDISINKRLEQSILIKFTFNWKKNAEEKKKNTKRYYLNINVHHGTSFNNCFIYCKLYINKWTKSTYMQLKLYL